MAKLKINTKDLDRFMSKLSKQADKDLQKEVALWLEASGFQFLEEVHRMIISMQVVDTRRLLNSFTKGGEGNIWTISSGGLSLKVGTNVDYAVYVNDGHWTNPKGVKSRFVPGYFKNGKFEYDPKSDTGMVLKQQWIEGQPYWDNALIIFEKMFQESFKKKLVQWSKQLGRRL